MEGKRVRICSKMAEKSDVPVNWGTFLNLLNNYEFVITS